nr:hypothetical protein [Ningiella ruwaisensis]
MRLNNVSKGKDTFGQAAMDGAKRHCLVAYSSLEARLSMLN